jgi:hypothetical protein
MSTTRLGALVAGINRGTDLTNASLVVNDLVVGAKFASFSGTLTGTSTAVTLVATTLGTSGNSISLTFTGSNSINSAISTWNTANPGNTLYLFSGDGTQVPSAGSQGLSGGAVGADLTQTILNNLLALQNGTNFTTGTNSHTHDGRYYTETQLNAATGTVGSTLIGDDNSYTYFTPSAATVKGALQGIDTKLGTLAAGAITALTGDVTATGPGSAAATIASIQGTTVSGTTGTGSVVFSASPTLTGTIAAAAMTLSSTLVATGAISGSNLTSAGHASADLALAGGTMSGNIAMGGNLITGLGAPTANGQALRFDQLGNATSGGTPGIATLDGAGKIPVAQLPSAVFIYQGTWNPSTNTPTLVDGTGVTGYVYWVSTAYAGPVSGLTNASMTNFQVGDLVLYNGTQWELTTPAAGVTSVNGAQGAVTVNAINQLTGDVTTSAASGSQSLASSVAKIQGTTVSGTTGTGNVVFSASPTLTGTLTAAAISASGSITGSNLSGTNTGDQTITLTGNVTGSGTGSFATTIANNVVTAAMLTTGAFDQATITGGNGTAASVQYAPLVKTPLVAGQTFTANTSSVVRWGVQANGDTVGRVYAADNNAASVNDFYAFGIALSTAGVSAGGTIAVVSEGPYTLGSSDATFSSGQVGLPLYLGTSGAWTTTAPTTPSTAVVSIGYVMSTTQIWVQPYFTGIN